MSKDFIIARTKTKDSKVLIKQLNYINIEKRNLCYHLVDNETKQGVTLTTTFYRAITPLDQFESLVFIRPSLLVNVSNIAEICTNKIIFEDGDILYLPRAKRQIIHEEWIKYHNFIN